jgi:hypothetical protein
MIGIDQRMNSCIIDQEQRTYTLIEHLVCLCLRTKKINLSFGDLTKTKQNLKMRGSS